MVRCIAMLALACTACSPAPTQDPATVLCKRIEERCPVVIDFDDYWRELPTNLAADEVVVEAIETGGDATTTRSASTEWIRTASGEQERACTQVQPIVIRHFRVVRVVSGAFDAPQFRLWIRSSGCGADTVRLDLKSPPTDGTPAYLVIRPAPALEGAAPIADVSRLGMPTMPIPRMVHRLSGLEPLPN